MTITVTENPVPVLTNWDIPPGAARSPIPRGRVVYQGTAVAIAAAVGETRNISINCGLEIGFSYRLTDARILMAGAKADVDSFADACLGRLLAYNNTTPSSSPTIFFRMDADALPEFPSDGSATPWKVAYQSNNLPKTPLVAQTGTTVGNFYVGATSTTCDACEMNYYIEFLKYDINQELFWAMNTPELVI